jgi:hypothetical protein
MRTISASGPGTGFRLARCVPRAAVVSRAVSMLVSAGSVSDLEVEKCVMERRQQWTPVVLDCEFGGPVGYENEHILSKRVGRPG